MNRSTPYIFLVALAAVILADHQSVFAADCRTEAEYLQQLGENVAFYEERKRDHQSISEGYWRQHTELEKQMEREGCLDRGDTAHCQAQFSRSSRLQNWVYAISDKIQRVETLILSLELDIQNAERDYADCQVTETAVAANPQSPVEEEACTSADAFTRTTNQAIAGANIGATSGVSVAECKELCLKEDVCKSIDYRPDNQSCWLSDKNSKDVAAKKASWARPANRSDWPTDYYERTCFNL